MSLLRASSETCQHLVDSPSPQIAWERAAVVPVIALLKGGDRERAWLHALRSYASKPHTLYVSNDSRCQVSSLLQKHNKPQTQTVRAEAAPATQQLLVLVQAPRELWLYPGACHDCSQWQLPVAYQVVIGNEVSGIKASSVNAFATPEVSKSFRHGLLRPTLPSCSHSARRQRICYII